MRPITTDPHDCHKYETCGAPICPYDTRSDIPWYPGEDVCPRHFTEGPPQWLKVQRRLAKKAENNDRYFTKAMLDATYAVRKETKGINPDTPGWRQRELDYTSSRVEETQRKRREASDRRRRRNSEEK